MLFLVLAGLASAGAPAPTLVGTWNGDGSCTAEMDGMEGADAATIQMVAVGMEQNQYVFTGTTMQHLQKGLPAPTPEPYKVLAHQGTSWTIEMTGMGGAPQRTEVVITQDRMRMLRAGKLVLCARRAAG